MQRKRLILSLAIVPALLLAMVSWMSCSAEKKPSEEEVAIVNGVAITKADLDRAMSMAQQQLLRAGRPPDKDQIANLRKDTLQGLISGELLFQESQKEGIKIDDAAVDKLFEKWRKRFPNDEEYQKGLKKWKTSEPDIKLQLRKRTANKKLIDTKFADKISIPEKEIKAFYDTQPDLFKLPEMVRASHILIKVAPGSSDARKAEARKKLQDIQEKLKKGEDFAALAKEFSQCPTSSSRGGDLNYFRRGQMVKPFEEVAFSLEPGKVSDVVETKFGYHLIRVVEKKPESTVPYEPAKGLIARRLKEKEILKKTSEYSQELRKNAKVEIYLKNGS
jgi:peptidyl-prolyl cis-trans isomerase C